MDTFETAEDQRSIKKFMLIEFAILAGLGLVCGIGYGIRTGGKYLGCCQPSAGFAVLSGTMFLMHQRAKHNLLKCSEQIKQDC